MATDKRSSTWNCFFIQNNDIYNICRPPNSCTFLGVNTIHDQDIQYVFMILSLQNSFEIFFNFKLFIYGDN